MQLRLSKFSLKLNLGYMIVIIRCYSMFRLLFVELIAVTRSFSWNTLGLARTQRDGLEVGTRTLPVLSM